MAAESLHAGDLYFKVYSVDTWDRHKIIGYGYHKLLIKPDSTTNQTAANIATWRPVTSHYHQLKTYFLGGSPEIDDVTYLKNQPSKVLYTFSHQQGDSITTNLIS